MDDKTRLCSMAYWYPRLCGLGIPMPETFLFPIANQMIESANMDEIIQGANRMGYPLFMRTDLSSGKHDWKNTCYVVNESSIVTNLSHLIEYNLWANMDWSYIVLRKFLKLESTFVAFPGDMPINKERRYFTQDGEVMCHHPYWPAECFDFEGSLVTADPKWKNKLDDLNREDDVEVALLTRYAEKASTRLPGCWSLDFAKTEAGHWFLIDAALGFASFHWPGCKNEYIRENR